MSKSPRQFVLLVSLVLITAVIWGTGKFISPYVTHTPVLFESGFPGSDINWHSQDTDYAVVSELSVVLGPHAEHLTKLSTSCPAVSDELKSKLLRVSVTGSIVAPGTNPNSTSVVGFWFVDDGDEIVRYHNIHFEPGRYKTSSSYKVVDWPEEASGCVFGLIAHVGGPAIMASSGSVDWVVENASYRVALTLAGMLILGFVLYVLFLASQTLSVLQVLFPVLIILALIIGVTVSGSMLVKYIHPLLNWALPQSVTGLGNSSANRTVLAWLFKSGHAFLFFAIALYFFSIQKLINSSLLSILFALLVVAVASEGVQMHLPDRGASGSDILFDWAGILTALLLCLSIRNRTN